MASFPISASQTKALRSLAIAFDADDTYDTARAKLSAAHVSEDGQVAGVAPRDAKKISDSDYARMLRANYQAMTTGEFSVDRF